MNPTDILENKYIFSLFTTSAGVLITILVTAIRNRRSVFTFNTTHNRIGETANDALYGEVKVTWNNITVGRLYMSTVELINQSSIDFENIKVKVFTNDTLLLSQSTQVVGTTQFLRFTDEYEEKIKIKEGDKPTEEQGNLYRKEREFIIPTMNRSQITRFQFLNAPKTVNDPTIWVDLLHKGIKLEYKHPPDKCLGVSRNASVLVGFLLGFMFLALVSSLIPSLFFSSFLCFIYGSFAIFPGAYTVKLINKVRSWTTG